MAGMTGRTRLISRERSAEPQAPASYITAVSYTHLLVVWSVLEQLGCGGSIAARRMLDLRPFEIVNATGCAVGRYQPVFELAGA